MKAPTTPPCPAGTGNHAFNEVLLWDNFWLDKLDQFNGDFVGAEMVKAFIDSKEYKQRFGVGN
jgi:hypothetical protein